MAKHVDRMETSFATTRTRRTFDSTNNYDPAVVRRKGRPREAIYHKKIDKQNPTIIKKHFFYTNKIVRNI